VATAEQIRGMLLEESLLYLLRSSGYKTVEKAGTDPTLSDGAAGLEVKGRGERHQIDAVADFIFAPPFSHPQRLLVEAKCFDLKKRVGLPVLRNAVGVLKDVSENWFSANNSSIPKHRYHYQFAIFSASGFTAEAQRYAFAHDIYLIPLENAGETQRLVNQIYEIIDNEYVERFKREQIPLKELRNRVRKKLKAGSAGSNQPDFSDDLRELLSGVTPALELCRDIGQGFLVVLSQRFPVFLTPSPDFSIEDLNEAGPITIHYRGTTWYIKSIGDKDLFTFDIPRGLFNLYSEEGLLTQRAALNMKSELFDQIDIFYFSDEGRAQIWRLSLNTDWLNALRQGVE